MKLLLFTSVDFPNGSAGSAHASLIVRGLRENGENAILVAPHATLMGNSAGNGRSRGHCNGVPYFYLTGSTTREKGAVLATLQSLRGMIIGSILVLRRWRKKKLDAIILSTPDTLEYLPLIVVCMLCRIPIILWLVERMTLSDDNPGWRKKLRYAGYALTEDMLPKASRGCIVISRELEKHFSRIVSPHKVLVSPILVDPTMKPQIRTRDVSPSSKQILYCGGFDKKDGVEYMIEAFKRAVEHYPSAQLVMTGRAPSDKRMQEIHALVKSRGMERCVVFTGFVSREELGQLQSNADVLLVCRTRSRFAAHGFPWKLGEYSQTGRPVVATRVGDIEEYFEDGKHLFFANPEDVDSIADRIIYVLDNYPNALLAAQRCKNAALEKLDYRKQMSRVAVFLRARLSNDRPHIEAGNDKQMRLDVAESTS